MATMLQEEPLLQESSFTMKDNGGTGKIQLGILVTFSISRPHSSFPLTGPLPLPDPLAAATASLAASLSEVTLSPLSSPGAAVASSAAGEMKGGSSVGCTKKYQGLDRPLMISIQ